MGLFIEVFLVCVLPVLALIATVVLCYFTGKLGSFWCGLMSLIMFLATCALFFNSFRIEFGGFDDQGSVKKGYLFSIIEVETP